MRNSLIVILLVLISAIYADLCTIEKEKICSSQGKSKNQNNHNNSHSKFESYSSKKSNSNYTHTEYTDNNKKAFSSKSNWDHISYVDLADNIEEYYINKWSNQGYVKDNEGGSDYRQDNNLEEFSNGELNIVNEESIKDFDSNNSSNSKRKARFLAKLINFMELYHDYQLQEIYDV